MKSFGYALQGIFSALKSERHMRIHACFAFYVIAAGFVTGLDLLSWTAVLICIALVFSLEMLNTALESLCDGVTKERRPEIKKAKDCAAGAVLFSACISAVVGCAVFFSSGRPEAALNFALEHKAAAGIIVLTLPAWIYFIFKKGDHAK